MSEGKKAKITPSFEENLEQLEKIVEELESGKLNLSTSLDKFQKGVDLYQKCKDVLEDAEKRISVLTEELKKKEYTE